jgi:O-methyltransferase domain/Dimerisation domain
MSTAQAGRAAQDEAAPNPEAILQLGSSFWASKTLLSAIELGLFTELAASGPVDAETLRKKLDLPERSARNFFDALVALRMLEREEDRYSNTAETDLFLDRNKPSYVGGLLEMLNARLFGFWNSLTEGLRTGEPQNEAKTGGNLFEAIYSDPALLKGFARAMTASSIAPAMAIASKFPWDRYKTVIDIGCAEGCVPVQVALAHAHMSGGGFDLAPMEPLFDEYVASAGLSDRLRFFTGDFFADPLPNADVLVMGRILHDWNLDEKRLLLEKAYAALPEGGALIVYEAIIDDDRRENAFRLLMSLNMLIETPGGFDYTGADCQGWMREVGFRTTRVEHLAGPDSMVVGVK